MVKAISTIVLFVCVLVGCAVPASETSSTQPAPATTADAGTEAFGACEVELPDGDAAPNVERIVTCADVGGDAGIVELRWGWDPGTRTFAGSCQGNTEAGCAIGAPCLVVVGDVPYQGGCL